MRVAAAAVYLAVTAIWIYSVPDAARGLPVEVAAVSLIPLALVHVELGILVPQWRIALLPLLAIVIAVPAADANDAGFPVLATAVLAPFGVALVALGVAARRVVSSQRRERAEPPAPALAVVAVAVVAFGVTLATLAVPQTVQNRRETANVEYGYPVHFVTVDLAARGFVRDPGATGFNPWEDPWKLDSLRLAVSWLLVFGALTGLFFGATRLVRTARALPATA